MRAVSISGGKIGVQDWPDPHPGGGEVLVQMSSAALNGADMIMRRASEGSGPDEPPAFPGLEFAGRVVRCGPNTSRFREGDAVMGILAGGGQAEYVVVHERQAMPVPAGVELAVAGAIPEAFVTAHDALVTQGQIRRGDRVLVHGAAGGVGTAAVQIARLAGAHVTATVRRAANHRRVAELGADLVIVPEAAVEHGPYDVIVELVGAPNFPGNVEALARRGRIVVIGVGAGAEITLNLRGLMTRQAAIRASMLRTRPLEEKARASRLVEHEVLPYIATGEIVTPVASSFPLEQAPDAYALFAAEGKLGNIVLTS